MFTFLIIVFVALLNISLGTFVFLRKSHSFTHRLILFLALIFASWSVINYYSLNSITESETLFWIRMVMVVTAPLGPVVLLLLKSFPSSSIDMNRKTVVLITLSACIVSGLALTPLVFKSVSIVNGNITPTPNIGILFYAVLFFGSLIWGIIAAIRKYRKSRGLIKLQYKFLFIGVIATFGLQVITNFIAVVFFNYSGFVALGPSFSLIFIAFLTYAIIRHRLLDIRLAVRRIFAQLLIISSILGLLLLVFVFYTNLTKTYIDLRIAYLIVSLVLLGSIMYEPIAYVIRRVTDKYLFSGVYSQSNILHELSMTLNTTSDFNKSLADVYSILLRTMHIQSITFVIKLEGRTELPEQFARFGENAVYSFGSSSVKIPHDFNWSIFLNKLSKTVFIEDFSDSKNKSTPDNEELHQWMNVNNISAVLPLKVKNQSVGVLLLGPKLSGDAYTLQDISTLETFSLQASIGIENIVLFLHAQDFNQRLKNEVNEATSELKQKNKNLEVLRKMDSIIMTTLEPKEISQKIVDTVAWELGYDGALLEIIDYKQSVLVPAAVSSTPQFEKALALLPRPLKEYVTRLDANPSMNVQSLLLKTKITTGSLASGLSTSIPISIANEMQKVIGCEGAIVYPILAKEQPLGVLTLVLHKSTHELTSDEHNLLDAFMDEVSIALENAYLYEEARSVNTALYESNKELIGLDKMKDEFVSIASHELRTPMTAINGYVWMLLQGKGGPLSDKQRYYLERVSQSSQRLINLVNDMLSVSRIESGRIQITVSDFDVVDMVKSVYEELQIKADEKKLGFSYSSSMPMMKAKGDPDKTREVITNLLGNALKFTDKGSITTRIEEKVDGVYIAVTDTGRGVAQEDIPKLFKKFGRLDNSLSTFAATTGTGLGLYICKKYIEAMKGHFDVTSELGKGSTFAFTVPKS